MRLHAKQSAWVGQGAGCRGQEAGDCVTLVHRATLPCLAKKGPTAPWRRPLQPPGLYRNQLRCGVRGAHIFWHQTAARACNADKGMQAPVV